MKIISSPIVIKNGHSPIYTHLAQMGTTVVMAIIWENRLVTANVGDSRAYLWKDHSLVQELINTGTISSADAHQHQHRNQLTRAVGISVSVNAEIREFELDRDSLVLLCTGGLGTCTK